MDRQFWKKFSADRHASLQNSAQNKFQNLNKKSSENPEDKLGTISEDK